MSGVRERRGKRKRVLQKQYKGAIKSRQPTIRLDLAHHLQFHLILSRSLLLFLPFPFLFPARRMCNLGQFYLPRASYRQLRCESFEISTLRGATMKPIGKSTSIGVRLRENLEKKRSHSWQLCTAFKSDLKSGEMLKMKWLIILEKSNKIREFHKFTNIR